jgi:hypothetical protein
LNASSTKNVNYAYPRHKSVQQFKDQVRKRTSRKAPVRTQALIDQINPVIRGWGNHYAKAHVRKLFNQLDRWIVRRIWSHRLKRWRCCGWKKLPSAKLYGEFGLVNLVSLIPSLGLRRKRASVKAGCGKIHAFKEWLKKARTLKTAEIWETAKAKLRGHFSYYGVTDNFSGISRFAYEVTRLLHKWLNRRGKRGCLNWEKFSKMRSLFPFPKPRIMVSMFKTL